MISHKHKAIFVHVPKAAGQSVEAAFLQDLNLDWSEKSELLLRANSDPNIGPQRLAHLYASEYVSLGHISQERFDQYTRFAVVRHPYRRVMSEYRFRSYLHTGPLWAFLRRPLNNEFSDHTRHMVPQSKFIFDENGKKLVDKIVKFENLAEEIAPIFKDIFGRDMPFPYQNRSKPMFPLKSKRLTDAHKRRIYEMHKEDFDNFGYDPEI